MPYESSEVSSNRPDGVSRSSVLSSVLCHPIVWSPWDHESESRINSRTFLGQFVFVSPPNTHEVFKLQLIFEINLCSNVEKYFEKKRCLI